MRRTYADWLRLPSLAAVLLVLAAVAARGGDEDKDEADAPRPLSIIVMDPLAAPLSCPCVQGYAQRDYQKLAEHLQKKLGRQVRLTFSEALKTALAGDAKGRADLVIGKHSVVLADADRLHLPLRAVASLTGKDGLATQTGLIVVPAGDPAQKVDQLQGYRILFGPPDCAEKYSAAMALLKSAGVSVPEKIETSAACSDGATKILELGSDARAAAVISSYAQPLLQGCGTIKKGDLRVVGTSEPVPFVTAFVAESMGDAERSQIEAALLDVVGHPLLCQQLETLLGFVPPPPAEDEPDGQPASGASAKKN